MKVITLAENTACRPDCGRAHGLCQYIETESHRILFDFGPNALFLENAQALGVDVSAVTLAVLSHGHYDHAGGMELFLKRNGTAPVFLRETAFGPYYAAGPDGSTAYIGPDPRLRRHAARFRYAGCHCVPAEGLLLFSDPAGRDYPTAANAYLLERTAEGDRPDPFGHEQNLLVFEGGARILFAGCAHRGIVNILRRAEELAGGEVDYVFGGFHLTSPGRKQDEPAELVAAIGEELAARRNTIYYTGHCTGRGPYAILSPILGDRLRPMSSGGIVQF